MELNARMEIEWAICEVEPFQLCLAVSNNRLVFVGGDAKGEAELYQWFRQSKTKVHYCYNHSITKEYATQLEVALRGEVTRLVVEMSGTAFQQAVWSALQTIPYGETRSYSDIAALINRPTATRAVATAIAKNPLTILIPCHRVIAKNGHLAGYRGGIAMKKQLLHIEAQNKGIM